MVSPTSPMSAPIENCVADVSDLSVADVSDADAATDTRRQRRCDRRRKVSQCYLNSSWNIIDFDCQNQNWSLISNTPLQTQFPRIFLFAGLKMADNALSITGALMAFVSWSAIILSVGQYSMLIFPCSTFSAMKW